MTGLDALAQMLPKVDQMTQDEAKGFLLRRLNSWNNYSDGMTEEEKQAFAEETDLQLHEMARELQSLADATA